jgi:hypothetical protein
LTHLDTVCCGAGGAASFYRQQVEEELGRPLRWFDAGLVIAGIPITVPLHSSWQGGVAWPCGAILEFEEMKGGELRTLDELDVGGVYRLYMTSSTAKWLRQETGRILGVAGSYGGTPLLVDLGEEVDSLHLASSVLNAAQLARVIQQTTNRGIEGFVASGDGFGTGFQLGLEGLGPVGLEGRIDKVMRQEHDGYASLCRAEGRSCLEISHLPGGTLERFEDHHLKRDGIIGEWDQPHIVDGATFRRLVNGWQ